MYYNNKVYVGYTPDLCYEYKEDGYVDSSGENDYPNYHSEIMDFYKFVYRDDPNYNLELPQRRNTYEYLGRIWVESQVISFWKYPEGANTLKKILTLLAKEVKTIYDFDIDYQNYIVDLNLEPDNNNFISLEDYVKGKDATEDEMEQPHLLPSNEKRKTQQMQAVRDYDSELKAEKFKNVPEYEWNFEKTKNLAEDNQPNNMLTDVANKLVNSLNELGIGSYIWHEATTGSVYIRFDDNRMNSIRIADHTGRNKLKYKYNIRTDLKLSKGKWVKDDGKWRYYLPIHLWKEMIDILIKQYDYIQNQPESKFNYTIPKFKQQKDLTEVLSTSDDARQIYRNFLNTNNPISKVNRKLSEFDDYKYIPISYYVSNNKEHELKVAFTDQEGKYEVTDYPVIYGEVESNVNQIVIRIVIDSQYKKENPDEPMLQLLLNPEVRALLYHETHHPITNQMFYNKEYDDSKNFYGPFKNVENTVDNNDMKHLFYYLSKGEMNSVIPQLLVKPNNKVIDIFKKYDGLTFEQFKQEFETGFPGKTFNNKLYNKIKDRINYFLRKYYKTLNAK